MTNLPVLNDARRQASFDLLYLLGRWFEPANDRHAVNDWNEVLEVAIATKTIGLLGPAIADPGVRVPADVAQKVAKARRGILVANLHNIDWTVKTVKPLQEAGIDPIVFKGALRSHGVYATLDARRSSDIDLLVSPENYDRAREVLIANGMIALVKDTSVWWHHWLGESPYARPNSTSPIVDIHHRVQQPGGPYPAKMQEFFSKSISQSVGSTLVRTLSAHHALLVCAINYGKAVRARKPWLTEIHEFARATRCMSDSELQSFRYHADRNNVRRLVDECFEMAGVLFPKSRVPSSPNEVAALNAVGHGLSLRFERMVRLWKWMDGSSLVRQRRFATSILRIFRTELALRREGLSSTQGART